MRLEYEVKQVVRALQAKPSTSLSARPIKTSSLATEPLAAYLNHLIRSCRCLSKQLCEELQKENLTAQRCHWVDGLP